MTERKAATALPERRTARYPSTMPAAARRRVQKSPKAAPKPSAPAKAAKPAKVEPQAQSRTGAGRAKLAAVVPMPARRPSLQAATLLAFDQKGRARFPDGEEVEVTAHASVDPIVLRGAATRGEIVVLQETDKGFVVLGALRARPTPGVDRADEYVIEADRVKVEASHAVALVAGAAEIAVRAVGFVETIARDITARAAGVHKIVGRMIHLN